MGAKTFHLFRLTDAAADDLSNAIDIIAAARPRLGMMIVPPRDWTYGEG